MYVSTNRGSSAAIVVLKRPVFSYTEGLLIAADQLMTDPQGAPESSSGWERLGKLLSYALSKHTPGEQLPPVPEELVEWSQDTLLATGAGMLLGGLYQWLEERRAGPILPPADAPTKAHAARAMAEEQTQRMARMANGTLKGGLRVGGLAAVFYAVQMLSGIYRNKRDFHDTAYGGMAAGALLGLSLGGGRRLRGGVLGAALGASIGVPAGLLQDAVVQHLPEEVLQRRAARFRHTEDIIAGTVKPDRSLPGYDYDVTAAVIQQLEASLSSSPTRLLQQQQQGEEQAGRGGGEGQAGGRQQGGSSRRWWQLWR